MRMIVRQLTMVRTEVVLLPSLQLGAEEPRYLQSTLNMPSLRNSPLSVVTVARSRIKLCSIIKQSILSQLCSMLKYCQVNSTVLYCDSSRSSYLLGHWHVLLKQLVSDSAESKMRPQRATHEVVHSCVVRRFLRFFSMYSSGSSSTSCGSVCSKRASIEAACREECFAYRSIEAVHQRQQSSTQESLLSHVSTLHLSSQVVVHVA